MSSAICRNVCSTLHKKAERDNRKSEGREMGNDMQPKSQRFMVSAVNP